MCMDVSRKAARARQSNVQFCFVLSGGGAGVGGLDKGWGRTRGGGVHRSNISGSHTGGRGSEGGGSSPPPQPRIRRAGEGGSGTQKFVYQKWPNKIFRMVNVVFPRCGHFWP